MPSTKHTNPHTAVAYIRVSTEDQRLGPEAQRAALEQYAARAGLQVVAWHVDAGVSGASELADRPGLTDALNALATTKAGVLLVAKRDRIARDVVIAAMFDRVVTRAGATVVAADGAGNGTSPADAFMRTIVDGAAAYELALIRARTKAALAAKRARGERAGACPFGYSADAAGRLVPDDAELAAVKLATTLSAQGRGVRSIAACLAEAGHVGRTGRPLGPTQVQRILVKARAA